MGGLAGRRLIAVVAALLAAMSAFVLPAWDASLPGGSIVWQSAGVVFALVVSLRVRHQLGAVPRQRLAGVLRLGASVASIIALVWLGGIAALWLLWPR